MLKNIKILAGIITVILFLTGCGPKTVSLPSHLKKNINSIEVVQNIQKPDLPFLFTRSEGFLLGLTGALGGAIIGSDMTKEEKFALYLKNNNIDITNIYNKTISGYIEKNDILKNKIVSKNGKYKLKSTITNYGLIYTMNMFSDEYKPTIGLTLELVDKNNTVVWSKNDYISGANSDTMAKPYNELFANPESMKEILISGTEVVTKILLKELSNEI